MNTVPSVLIVNNQIGAAGLIQLQRLLNYICQKCGAYLTEALNRVAALNRSFTVYRILLKIPFKNSIEVSLTQVYSR